MKSDRRRPILVNRYERTTDTELRKMVEKRDARVCPKVRIADVLDIEQSGISDAHYYYALRAHFDFLVVDEPSKLPLFAVEFDGPMHKIDPDAVRRDQMKNDLVEFFDFGFVRITSDYLKPIPLRRYTLLGWLVDIWFISQAFDEAQDRGEIPYDEPFCYFAVGEFNDDGTTDFFAYDVAFPTRVKLSLAYKKGLVGSWGPTTLSNWSVPLAYAFIPLPGLTQFLVGKASCFMVNFQGIGSCELANDLAILDLGEKLDGFLKGTLVPSSKEQMDALRQQHREEDGWSTQGATLPV
jgi:hypothetical protein